MNTPIDCTLHDHLEIACLYRYDLRVVFQDGTSVEGCAVNTATLPDKTEVLQLIVETVPVNVPMHTLATIEVLTPNAQFQTLNFTSA